METKHVRCVCFLSVNLQHRILSIAQESQLCHDVFFLWLLSGQPIIELNGNEW